LETDRKFDRLHQGKKTESDDKSSRRKPVVKKKRRGASAGGRGVTPAGVSGGTGVKVNRGIGRKYTTSATGSNFQGEKLHGTEPTEHYRLKLSEIPFIIGKVSFDSPSYSIDD